ncbi:MAG: hypothetical protein WDN49_15600 [Acetobacteraceae bacterium]
MTAAAATAAQPAGTLVQPHRDDHHGGTDNGPRNLSLDAQNPDILNPPSTDRGTVPNLRFSFSDSHVRQEQRLDPAGHSAGTRRVAGHRRV